MICVPLIVVIPDAQEDDDNSKYFLRKNYLTALEKQGGAPVIVPYSIKNVGFYMQFAHGVMIAGGKFTIDPEFFNQRMQCNLPINSKRTQVEWAYCQEALQRKMPILGICGGMQLINVVLGGSLIQDLSRIPNVSNHNVSKNNVHSVQILPDTYLSQYLKCSDLDVNSSHCQSVDRLGHEVRINALSPDGVIEGIEHTQHPFCLGVQWHPEYFHQNQNLFSEFVQACRMFRKHEK
ncbi:MULTISPECIES: gamma-glutamyl-gamma-aminobutyrate hydrolase family protein [Holospora]|uniref:Putative glutamine amidotransferase-like protein n=2 Tax=Holospora TaxID=44747 RepID=A0A061JGC5_9PROT|nr:MULTISPECIES: gamma-glutamyl-gamma-aminobutyrate hydrolase family protein [Holospora]ETZ05056.1 putative glutamine amidotransferase-like protein [Holospora undulata HU1]GAJ46011.1 putative glutamine amidotransferase-like protein RP404 [Holospora elegans E1]